SHLIPGGCPMQITRLFPRARAAVPRDAESATAAEAIAAVRVLNQQYIAAARTNDAEWFRRQVADDAVIVLGDGRRLRKPDFLALLNEEPKLYLSLAVRDVTLRAFGNVVQVDADAPWELADGTTGVSRYIDTWVRLEGRWQVVSAQVTPLAE
ncbi:MAG: nuclear transport factor 2 family protein, partial [Candidatus Limnocylindria bacterium]